MYWQTYVRHIETKNVFSETLFLANLIYIIKLRGMLKKNVLKKNWVPIQDKKF